MLDIIKVVSLQEDIIRNQSELINEIFSLLMQHVSEDEFTKMKSCEKMTTIKKLKEQI